MAMRVTFHLVDDLDGTMAPDVVRVAFELDGTRYEIDLTAANAARLRSRLAAYIRVARRMGESPVPALTLQGLRRTTAAAREPTLVDAPSHRSLSAWDATEQKSA